MASRGYLPGVLSVVDVPSKEKPEVLMLACNRGYLIPLEDEELESLVDTAKDRPQFVQWYEYWSDNYEED